MFRLIIGKEGVIVFPTELDGADVLYYTPRGDYGAIKHPDGNVADYYHYLAICKYPKDDNYYLFCCNENYEVVSDWMAGSIEDCKKSAALSYKEAVIRKEVAKRCTDR